MRRETLSGLVLAGAILAGGGCGSHSENGSDTKKSEDTVPQAATDLASLVIATELAPGGVSITYYKDGSRDMEVPSNFSDLIGTSNIIIHEFCIPSEDGLSGTLYTVHEQRTGAGNAQLTENFPACSDGLLRPDEFGSLNVGTGS